MRPLRPLLALLAITVAMLAASCSSSGGGSATLPSGVTRPTQAPTTAPSGGGPTSSPPRSSAEAPSSDPATTNPPATEAPTTSPPRTEAPATTEPAREATTTAAGSSTTEAAADESSSSSWWPWLLVGLAVLAIIVGLVLFLRPRKAPRWPAQTAAALDESDQITTHLVGLAPGGLGAVASADATRLATLMASVQQLVASAPDDRVTDAR